MKHTNVDSENNIDDFIIYIVKYRKQILSIILSITLSSIVVSFLLPKEYTATSSIISPKKKGGLLGDIGGFSNTIKDISRTLGGRLGNISDESYNFLVILQSRTVLEKVIQKFDLKNVYEMDDDEPIEDLIKELRNQTEFKIEDEGNFIVSVTDRNPQRAADMANYFVELLNEMSLDLAESESKKYREFIEKRYFKLLEDISTIENQLEKFSKTKNIIAIEEQMKAGIKVAVELNTQLELLKIQKQYVVESYGANNPLNNEIDIKLSKIEAQIKNLKRGMENDSSIDLFVPFNNVQTTGIQYMQLMRNFEIQNRLLQFIYPAYEQAKLEEQKNIPILLVVDFAKIPEKKSSPKRVIIVTISFIVSIMLSIMYVSIIRGLNNYQKNQTRYLKIVSALQEK